MVRPVSRLHVCSRQALWATRSGRPVFPNGAGKIEFVRRIGPRCFFFTCNVDPENLSRSVVLFPPGAIAATDPLHDVRPRG